MPRLPSALEPAFPVVKRVHRASTRVNGGLVRKGGPWGVRAVPYRGTESSWETAALEPEAVTIHAGPPAEVAIRQPPAGIPEKHWFTQRWGSVEFTQRYTLDIRDGVVATRNAVHITPGGTLDYATSNYFGVTGWREHPLYLRSWLPPVEHVPGTVLSLATRGTWANYYHMLLDVLPRWGVFQECLPGVRPDAFFVNRNTSFARQLLELVGLGDVPTIEPTKRVAIRADRLLVPSLENIDNEIPPQVTRWLRENLPPQRSAGLPRRIYITRGDKRNSRRVVNESAVFDVLRGQGFERFDPGTASVQDQIDHFAAAEVIVAPHGAALANLSFCSPGARVLELFAPGYLFAGYWAITTNIPDVHYRYLIGEGPGPRPGGAMNHVLQDITVDLKALEQSLEELLSAGQASKEFA